MVVVSENTFSDEARSLQKTAATYTYIHIHQNYAARRAHPYLKVESLLSIVRFGGGNDTGLGGGEGVTRRGLGGGWLERSNS